MFSRPSTYGFSGLLAGIALGVLCPAAGMAAAAVRADALAPPTTTGIADVAVLEDAGPSAVDLFAAFDDAEDPDEAMTYTIESVSADGLLTTAIDPATGILTLSYLPDANGVAVVTVRATDTESLFAETSFSVTITPVNDPPAFTPGGNVSVNEDAGAQSIPNWASGLTAGPANEAAQSLSFSLNVGNPALFSVQPALSSDGTLTFTPAPNASGVTSIGVTLSDNEDTSNGGLNTSNEETFTITIVAQADPPTTSGIADVTVLEDASNTVIDLFAAFDDPDNPDSELTFSVISNTNTSLFSAVAIDQTSGTLTLDYAADLNGAATLTVRATDPGGLFVDAPFTVTVTAVNDAPSFVKGSDISIGEDAGAQTFASWATALSAGPANESTQTLTFSASATNSTLFSVQPAVSAAGTLSFTPAANASGVSTVTVTLADNGGTANGGVDTSPAQTFTITISGTNDAPTTSGIAGVTVLEDAASSTVDLFAAFADAEDPDNALVYTVQSNTNPALFASTAINGTAGTLTLDYAADANGSGTLTVRATDTGGLFVDAAFTVTVTAVNDAPSFVKGSDISIGEDAGAQTFASWATALSAGPANESTQTLTFSASATNSTLFSVQPAVSRPGRSPSRRRPTPAASAPSPSRWPTTAARPTAASTPARRRPSPSPSPAPTTRPPPPASPASPSSRTPPAARSISSPPSPTPEDPDNALVYTVQSNTNPALFASTAINGTAGTLTLDYAADANGSGTPTVRATDTGGPSSTPAFTVTVTAVNDAPSFVKGPDQTVSESGPPVSIPNWATNISAGPANESSQTLTFSTSNTNNALFTAQPAVSSTGTLTFNLANNASGSATVTVTLADNGGTANGGVDTSAPQTFVINVSDVNDPPTTTGIANVTDLEDAPNRAINLFAAFSDPENADNQLVYSVVSNSNPILFSALPIDGVAGTLTLDYAPNAFGTSALIVRATDTGGLFVDAQFTVTLTAVNDAPVFTKGANLSVPEDSPAQVVPGWATGIAAGPVNETGQVLAFQVSTPSTTLFSVQPAITPTGVLSYTPAPDASGTAVVTVVLQDDGGVQNGGVDQSAAQTFTISLTAINDLPVAVDDNYTVLEGQSLIASAGGSPPGVLDNDTDADRNTLTATVIQPPQFASTWSFNTNGSFVYVHDGSENTVDRLTYVANDGFGNSNVATVTFTIKETNDAPQTTGIGNVTVLEDAIDTAIPLYNSFNDPDDADDALTYTIENNTNAALFESVGIAADTGILTLNYAPNANGSATLTVRATDPGALFVQTSFSVTVTPVNDPPSMVPGDNITLGEDEGPQSIPGWATAISVGPPDEASQALSISLVNDNNALFTVQPILTVANGVGALAFTPAPNAGGVANVTINLTDNGGTANGGISTSAYTFVISINSDNDPPTSIGIADATVLEDAAPLTYNLFDIFSDVEDADDQLVFSIEGDVNEALFASVTIAGSPAILTITFAPDAFGTGSLGIRATDTGGLWKQEDVVFTVNAVNDAPSFVAGPDQALAQNASLQSVPGWATEITPGAANEAEQSLDFILTTDNDALFLVLPDVSPDGTLSYAPAQGDDVFGEANVSIVLADNGGTENGGVDRSEAQTFKITINRFNTQPNASDDNYIVRQGATLTVPAATGVLANDSDLEDDALTARIVNPPTNAAAFSLTADGSFSYRHNNSQTTGDSFTYVANDGIDDSDAATVFITITPTGTLSLPDVVVLEDADDTVLDLRPTFAPQFPAGSVLTYRLATSSSATLFSDVAVDSLSGLVTIAYAPNQNGIANLSFRATSADDETRTASVTVTVLPLNDAPIAVDDIAATIENEPVLVNVLANDVDPDGDDLIIQSFSSPNVGTVQPGADGTFLYNPPADYTGRATFSYTVVDDSSATDRATVTITVFAGRFDIVDLGLAGSDVSAAFGISNIGEVVGSSLLPGNVSQAFSSSQTLETTGMSTAYDVNDFGAAVGAHLFNGALLAARWDSLGLTRLGAFDGRSSLAYGINNEGLVVGTSTKAQTEVLRAFLWRDGRLNEMQTASVVESQAFDISERGLAVGYAGASAVIWDDVVISRTLAGALGRAYALNESGQVVGSIDDGTVKAAFWERNGALQVIHDAASSFSEAYGINNSTWVVGAYLPAVPGKNQPLTAPRMAVASAQALRAGAGMPADSLGKRGANEPVVAVASAGEMRAFLWRNGVSVDLNDFIDAGSGWTLVEALGINNAAQIVGYGLRNGVKRAFLLSPSNNSAPKAQDDVAALTYVERIEIDLLANDRDEDGDSLRVVSVTQGAFGSVALVNGRMAIYTPGPEFEGEDVFSYTVTDGRGGLSDAQVTVMRSGDALPASFALEQNYPNPFNPTTTIAFSLPEASDVVLDVFNLLGQRVGRLIDGPRTAGQHRVVFDAGDLPGGVYVYRIRAGAFTYSRKLVLLK
ncbi:MAG: Ig-like domain-containing protein [Rhodothermales bacterium]